MTIDKAEKVENIEEKQETIREISERKEGIR